MAEASELRLQWLVVPLDRHWQLATRSPDGGAYLRHVSSGLTLHVRPWHRHGDAEWLRAELRDQSWAGPVIDVDERPVAGGRLIAGTFRYDETDQLVREWFISNGTRGANASLLFPVGTSREQLAPYEGLLDSLAFPVDSENDNGDHEGRHHLRQREA